VTYTIEFRPAAYRDLRDLPLEVIRRISRRIDALASNPRPPEAEKLAGCEGLYRVRVGNYRILYEIRDEVLLVIVIRVRHRREAYRK
jgi:mRNA interferase RelE/StbE